MVLNHQTQMINHMTRVGWEARVAAAEPSADANARVTEAAADLVDYMLFLDEAAARRAGEGVRPGYAEWFAAQGPRDAQGPVAARVRSDAAGCSSTRAAT